MFPNPNQTIINSSASSSNATPPAPLGSLQNITFLTSTSANQIIPSLTGMTYGTSWMWMPVPTVIPYSLPLFTMPNIEMVPSSLPTSLNTASSSSAAIANALPVPPPIVPSITVPPVMASPSSGAEQTNNNDSASIRLGETLKLLWQRPGDTLKTHELLSYFFNEEVLVCTYDLFPLLYKIDTYEAWDDDKKRNIINSTRKELIIDFPIFNSIFIKLKQPTRWASPIKARGGFFSFQHMMFIKMRELIRFSSHLPPQRITDLFQALFQALTDAYEKPHAITAILTPPIPSANTQPIPRAKKPKRILTTTLNSETTILPTSHPLPPSNTSESLSLITASSTMSTLSEATATTSSSRDICDLTRTKDPLNILSAAATSLSALDIPKINDHLPLPLDSLLLRKTLKLWWQRPKEQLKEHNLIIYSLNGEALACAYDLFPLLYAKDSYNELTRAQKSNFINNQKNAFEKRLPIFSSIFTKVKQPQELFAPIKAHGGYTCSVPLLYIKIEELIKHVEHLPLSAFGNLLKELDRAYTKKPFVIPTPTALSSSVAHTTIKHAKKSKRKNASTINSQTTQLAPCHRQPQDIIDLKEGDKEEQKEASVEEQDTLRVAAASSSQVSSHGCSANTVELIKVEEKPIKIMWNPPYDKTPYELLFYSSLNKEKFACPTDIFRPLNRTTEEVTLITNRLKHAFPNLFVLARPTAKTLVDVLLKGGHKCTSARLFLRLDVLANTTVNIPSRVTEAIKEQYIFLQTLKYAYIQHKTPSTITSKKQKTTGETLESTPNPSTVVTAPSKKALNPAAFFNKKQSTTTIASLNTPRPQ